MEEAGNFALSESGEVLPETGPYVGKAPMSPFGIETHLNGPQDVKSRECITWDSFSVIASVCFRTTGTRKTRSITKAL